jgi:hypothetical protein
MQDNPFADIESAISAIDRFLGRPEDFRLAISDSLLDPIGVNMAMITDRILARGWFPVGFEQRDGYRLYSYVG